MISLGPLRDKFSESAQKVINRAVEESRRREHNFLSVEHIFYALGEVEGPLLTKVLQSNGVDPQMITSLLEQELSKPHHHLVNKQMYLTDPTRELFTRALKRARLRGRQRIESSDLFVSLFADPTGTPADMLRRLGADPDRLANLELDDMSVEEYLESEKDSPVRHEYIDGQIYAMVGASDRHNRIAGNLYNRLDDHLGDGPCEPFISDMKVWVSETVYYYPDVVVACDGPDADAYYRKQPCLIIEVSSPGTVPPGTERIDRAEKLIAYKQVKSLKEYVIVSQDRLHIEVFRRQRNGRWQWEVLTESDDELRLESVGLTLSLTQVYRRVKFPQRARRR